MLFKSSAKINLVLEILDRDISGYHEISTVFQEIELCDKLEFTEINHGFEFRCEHPEIPNDESNLIFKAYNLLKRKYQCDKGIKVILNKNIPLGSGLGGGSGNAATTLKALNQLWQINLATNELEKLASEIGMDVPFFIQGGTQLGTHFGEQVHEISNNLMLNLLIAVPKVVISTQNAYENLDLIFPRSSTHTQECLDAFVSNDLNAFAKAAHNDFEKSVFKKYPQIKELRDNLIAQGALCCHLTGSGAGVYAVFRGHDELRQAERAMQEKDVYVWHN